MLECAGIWPAHEIDEGQCGQSVESRVANAVRGVWAGEVGRGQFQEDLIGPAEKLGLHSKYHRLSLKIYKMDNNASRFAFWKAYSG